MTWVLRLYENSEKLLIFVQIGKKGFINGKRGGSISSGWGLTAVKNNVIMEERA